MYSKYKKFIEKYIDITVEDWTLYTSKLKIVQYKKGHIIHNAGDTCNSLAFINSGLVRSYIVDPNGKDYTWNIMFNDEKSQANNLFVVDYYSFITRKKSMMNIEVLEDCELLMMHIDDVHRFHGTLQHEETFSRYMTEIAYITLHEKIIDRQIKTAEERFDDFMRTTPYLLGKVPQYHIATYLGMTPQYLSQLKKESKY